MKILYFTKKQTKFSYYTYIRIPTLYLECIFQIVGESFNLIQRQCICMANGVLNLLSKEKIITIID